MEKFLQTSIGTKVEVITGVGVDSLKGNSKVDKVVLSDGREIEANVVA